MNDATRYIECKDYRAGYDAAALGEPYDQSRPISWEDGWQAFQNDERKSEIVKFI